VTLFDGGGDLARERPARTSRRRRIGWLVLGGGIVASVVLAMLPAPYVIEQPGPVFDTLGSASGSDGTPLIEIPDEKTYPTEGSLDLLTVSVLGSPTSLPSWAEVATAWFDPSRAVVPVEAVYPSGTTTDEVNEQNRIEMQNSQQNAIAAALTELGRPFSSTLTVAGLISGSPSAGLLQVGDEIVSLNGAPVDDVAELQDAIRRNGAGTPAEVGILRSGSPSTVPVTPVLSQSGGQTAPVLGILVGTEYDFPFTVTIQLNDVGGPSAGMMFALGIIDKLTPGALTGGERVAGTGTITAQGEVGAIGGIRQKMYGAQRAGARYFLAPEANCDEVASHVPSGLTVVAVKTLADSLTALGDIAAGTGVDRLPACTAR